MKVPVRSDRIVPLLLAAVSVAAAEDGHLAPPMALSVPQGFSIELVAGPPLVERPIVAAFDDEGRLYVAESSGSNDPVEKQLAERPHRIVRLEDADGDGRFDNRTVFADRMMFPEGAMFFDGSLFVAAPPSIWKLSDRDGDGLAEERVEWFQGKTLTGCANDLHGPYAGPDGWIYWCKGAFAEQQHMVNGREFRSRAAHIHRCRPDGTGLEPVMTGGMDNPVDVVFTPEGERIFSATFLQVGGRQDGLVHAIYGGVYGKNHGVLDGHPRTGELMPAMALMNSAAPCGLERYESEAFGADFRDNLFACQFNLRKVSRHVLRAAGSSFASEDSDFVTSDNVDFHPTDVLMDADGSLLIIDTGGWYKLCCPTSQLWKPDVLGGIYRVRRIGAVPVADPRGQAIAWSSRSVDDLWDLLSDGRPAVRQRATREFAQRRDSAEMDEFLAALKDRDLAKLGRARLLPSHAARQKGSAGASPSQIRSAALARTWAIAQLENADSRRLVRQLLDHADARIRQAALNAVSLHRDADALPQLLEILARDDAANRRVAAEALGRIGDRSAVTSLLAAASAADDRILQHSVTYALIELADAGATRAGLASGEPGTMAAAMLALDQMAGGEIHSDEVIPHLKAEDARLRGAALWLVTQHPEWGGKLAGWFQEQLAAAPAVSDAAPSESAASPLESMLVGFVSNADIQALIAETVISPESSPTAKQLALRIMARAKLGKPPAAWLAAVAQAVAEAEPDALPLAVAAARALPGAASNDQLSRALSAVAERSEQPSEVRVAALAVVAPNLSEVTAPQFGLLADALSPENSVGMRSAAADALAQAPLSPAQLDELCELLKSVSPLELNHLLAAFERSTDEQLGLKLISSLREASVLPSLRVDVLRAALSKYGDAVQQGVDELESLVNVDAAAQRQRIEELLPLMSEGDVRRGHAVFYSSKAACSACHRLGYAGGTVGPELTRIGEIRTERDLLESILYPNLSFVQTYESVLVLTTEGKAVNGRIVDESDEGYLLATGPDEQLRVRRDEIDQMQPSTVSVMPAGLDRQLSVEELADLVAFLKSAK